MIRGVRVQELASGAGDAVLVGAFSPSKSALNFFLFAPRARSRHSASHDSRLGEKFVDFKKL